MKKIKFTLPYPIGGYVCDKSGDQSGEYVSAEIAEELLLACKAGFATLESFYNSSSFRRPDSSKCESWRKLRDAIALAEK